MDSIPTTDLRIAAQIRASNAAGIPAYLVRRGEAERGTILLKLNLLDGTCEIWTEIRMPEGDLGWMKITKTDAEANDYVERATARDPDLWVVEIEDRAGINPFEGKKII